MPCGKKDCKEDIVTRTWTMKVGGYRKIRRLKLRWSDVNEKRHERERIKERRSTIPENVEIGKLMCQQPQKKIHVAIKIHIIMLSTTIGRCRAQT